MLTLSDFQKLFRFTDADLQQNRLGLLTARQADEVRTWIPTIHQRFRVWQGSALVAGSVITIIAFLLVPQLGWLFSFPTLGVAGVLEISRRHILNNIEIDLNNNSVRIVPGAVQRTFIGFWTIFPTIIIEWRSYRLLVIVPRDFFYPSTFYRFFVLPHSRIVVAAEKDPKASF